MEEENDDEETELLPEKMKDELVLSEKEPGEAGLLGSTRPNSQIQSSLLSSGNGGESTNFARKYPLKNSENTDELEKDKNDSKAFLFASAPDPSKTNRELIWEQESKRDGLRSRVVQSQSENSSDSQIKSKENPGANEKPEGTVKPSSASNNGLGETRARAVTSPSSYSGAKTFEKALHGQSRTPKGKDNKKTSELLQNIFPLNKFMKPDLSQSSYSSKKAREPRKTSTQKEPKPRPPTPSVSAKKASNSSHPLFKRTLKADLRDQILKKINEQRIRLELGHSPKSEDNPAPKPMTPRETIKHINAREFFQNAQKVGSKDQNRKGNLALKSPKYYNRHENSKPQMNYQKFQAANLLHAKSVASLHQKLQYLTNNSGLGRVDQEQMQENRKESRNQPAGSLSARETIKMTYSKSSLTPSDPCYCCWGS